MKLTRRLREFSAEPGRAAVRMFADVSPRPSFKEQSYVSDDAKLRAQMDLPGVNPDIFVEKRGDLTIYDDMGRDETIHAILTAIKQTRLHTSWSIIPYDESPEHKLLAEQIEWHLRQMKGTLKRSLFKMLSALDYGFSITEVVPRVEENAPAKLGFVDNRAVTLKKLATRKPHHFNFKTDGHGNLRKKGLVQDVSGEEVLLNPDDFVHYVYNDEWDSPWGRSMLQSVYRAWYSKDWVIRFFNRALERFAGGIAIATLPDEAGDEELAQMQEILKSLQEGSEITLPSGYKLTIQEIQGGGLAAFERAVKMHNAMIAAGLLYPNRLGLVDFEGGSYNLAETHFDLWMAVLDDIGADLEEEVMGENIIPKLTRWNNEAMWQAREFPTFKFEPLTSDDKFKVVEKIIEAVKQGLIEWSPADTKQMRDLLGLPQVPDDAAREDGRAPSRSTPRGGGGGTPPQEEEPDNEESGGDADETSFTFAAKKKRTSRTMAEQRVDFARIQQNWDDLDSQSAGAVADAVKLMRDETLRWVTKSDVVHSQDFKAVSSFKLKHVNDVERAVRAAIIRSYLHGKLDVLNEVEKGHGAPLKFIASTVEFVASPLGQALALLPEEALVSLKKRKALLRRFPLTGKELAVLKDKAFWVTGITKERLVNQVKGVLYHALETGDMKLAKAELTKLFNEYLATGQIPVEGGQAAGIYKNVGFRAETVVRTNISQAYNNGRMTMLTDPVVDEIVEAYQWTSVLDDNTTDYCESIDGDVFLKDEFVQPPAHQNCRSIVVPVIYGDTYKLADRPFPRAGRGKGFVDSEWERLKEVSARAV